MKVNRYYQIGQVCKITDLPHSTIRFWEKTFNNLRPTRSSGGHRYYSLVQVELIQRLKKLLYEDGYTIDGAKKYLSAKKATVNDQLESNTESEPIIDGANSDAMPDEDLRSYVKAELQEILLLLNRTN